jgi:hypothetical protein
MLEEQDNEIERRGPGGISRRSETARRGRGELLGINNFGPAALAELRKRVSRLSS